jgi:quinoprotein glucose dehydrogenase
MLSNRIQGSIPRRGVNRRASLGLLLALGGCGPSPEPVPAPVARPEARIAPGATRLDSAAAARLAREARQAVPAQLADGLELSLWAPEQLIANPIALEIDHLGRVYVTRTNRDGNSTIDIRGHPRWMAESLTFQTVEDRRRFLRRELAPERSERNEWLTDMNEDGSRDWRDLVVAREQLYRIQDTTGDGLADISQVMLDDFHAEVTDLAGGLLVHGEDIYFGVAPDLWRLRDDSGDGVIDSRESISHGYGVHVGFGGHGVSGVTLGPDGRIYWSVGDVGLNVVDREGRRWAYPHQGAILRANPDGSDFEVFAAGLRNIHEFAFDEYGNLISVDNDGDHPGETERLVYITDGQDSGWRINWQFGKYTDPGNNGYKVWMDEGMYRPRFEGQAAYFTPPLAAYHTGPAGLVYNPGTALGARWRGHFFVSEFTGTPGTSKIHAFRLRAQGAGFELARDTVLMTGVLTTGMAFGPDGALYLADWIEGWDPKGKGRIWKLDSPADAGAPMRAETRTLLAEPFGRRSAADLLRLLRHADMRVRQKAQFELVGRADAKTLLAAARRRDHRLARVHGLWGIGQLARRDARQAARLPAFLRDADPEIRAQAARLIGDVRHAAAADALVPLLRDPSARARFFAAEALGRLRHAAAVQPLVAMLEANDDRDVYLRHAGTLALARIGHAEPVLALADHPSRALRIAAVVALRRMQHPGVARFLADRDEYVVTEAARAINDDASIEGALPALARVLEEGRFTSEALLRRAVNANLRLGTAEAAQRLASFAARMRAPEEMRVEALASLGVWPRPSILDRVDGAHRGSVQRDPSIARAAVAPLVEPLMAGGSTALKVALVETVGRLALERAAPVLLARLRRDPAPEVRIAAVKALRVLGPGQMEAALRLALADPEPRVRMIALGMIPELKLPEATTAELLASLLGRGSVGEQQSAVGVLGNLRSAHAHRVLGGLVEQFVAGKLPAELQLDLVEAVQASNARVLQARLERGRTTRRPEDALAAFGVAVRGGNAERGKQVVFRNAAAQCTRCHSFGDSGAQVGPNLRRIGATLSREQLLEALVAPSARIAPGYGTVPSGMPPMGHILSPREIRDVVEYLSTLK